MKRTRLLFGALLISCVLAAVPATAQFCGMSNVIADGNCNVYLVVDCVNCGGKIHSFTFCTTPNPDTGSVTFSFYDDGCALYVEG